MHLVEADEVEPGAPQIPHNARKKARRDFKEAIGLKTIGPRRPHVMQRQDRADARDEGFQRNMRTAEIKSLQSAADDLLPKPGH
jgi:hypothetical protein